MLLFPAIDFYEGCAVRLIKGDYEQKTVYSENPLEVAEIFKKTGVTCIHMVDLEGARDGNTPNLNKIIEIKNRTGLFCQVGGGIRSVEVAERYLAAGMDRVIIGTAAVEDEEFLKAIAAEYGSRIAVGVDLKDGCVAVKGWREKSEINGFDFCRKLDALGIDAVICTDISKDGVMEGSNNQLYRDLQEVFSGNIIASGGVSSLDDIRRLKSYGIYGAIMGKAYYSGAVKLEEALEAAK